MPQYTELPAVAMLRADMLATLAAEAPLNGANEIATVIANWLVSPVGRVRQAQAVDAVDRFNRGGPSPYLPPDRELKSEPLPEDMNVFAIASAIGELRRTAAHLSAVVSNLCAGADGEFPAETFDALAETARKWGES